MIYRVCIFLIAIIASLNTTTAAKRYGYRVVESYPHSTDSYTQGLEIVDGVMYESTGLNGESRLMRVDMTSGKTEQLLAELPEKDFGEGITILGDSIYMLTWRSGVMYIFDKESGEKIDQRRYAGEGWGLTSDGERLYMSNGSNRITIRERENFEVTGSRSIVFNGQAVNYLNELEWIEGKIWANIYTTDQIVIIDPQSWEVEGVIDLTGLLPAEARTAETDVLNGIAYDREEKKIYVTGKNWSLLFEIEIFEI